MKDENEEFIISKSQVKREMQALRDLGEELVALPAAELNKFDISESLHDAILLARNLKREALRRQIQRIGKLLREEDDVLIKQTLRQISQPQRDEVRTFHQLEQWRDQLMTGGDEAINQTVESLPGADRQHLRQLVRSARKERQQDKPPKSARLLFQYLKELTG
jgi:ribosome-associated protein